jgi:hypothetical protein
VICLPRHVQPLCCGVVDMISGRENNYVEEENFPRYRGLFGFGHSLEAQLLKSAELPVAKSNASKLNLSPGLTFSAL